LSWIRGILQKRWLLTLKDELWPLHVRFDFIYVNNPRTRSRF
ncbi:MAG: hypothetical protein RL240_2293, partial [Planctomycetota bacterium]